MMAPIATALSSVLAGGKLPRLLQAGPRARGPVPLFERFDVRPAAFRQVDIVPAVQQLVAADRIDRERINPITAGDRLQREIDGDLSVGLLRYRGRQLCRVRIG